MTFGLSDTGFTTPRAIDLRDQIRAEYESETNLQIDWDADVFLGVITGVLSDRIGDLSEALQALADSRDPDNATGSMLDAIAAIVGISRIPAAFSRVDLTLIGDAGTVIPEGSEVEHPNGTLWRTSDAATIGADGTATIEASPQETGAIPAPASALWEIVTPVDGWDTVTTAADATQGRDRETDSAFRLRRQESLQVTGAAALDAIRSNVLLVDGITAAIVVDNDLKAEATVAGLTLPGSSLAIIVYPNTLTADQKTALVETIYERAPAGIETVGDESEVVTGGDGFAKTIKFFYAQEVPVDVVVEYTGSAGLEDAIEETIDDYFTGLGVGEPARILAILSRIAAVEGTESATVTLDGSATDIVPEITEIAVAGTISVTQA